MNKYIAVSSKHFVNLGGNRIFTESSLVRPYDILVPWYLEGKLERLSKVSGFGFDLSDGDTIKLQNITRHSVPSLELNNLSVIRDGGIQLTIKDNRGDKSQSFKFSEHIPSKNGLVHVEWIHCNKEFKHTVTRLGKVFHAAVYANDFVDIGEKTAISYGIGLTNKPFAVYHKGVQFAGTCYVLLLGVVAVLLQDDLSPDAVVIADSYNAIRNNPYLRFSRLVWSSNPYILGMYMMNGGDT